jgi:hypothetical protein
MIIMIFSIFQALAFSRAKSFRNTRQTSATQWDTCHHLPWAGSASLSELLICLQ